MTKKVVHLTYSLGFGGLEQVIVNLINNSQGYAFEHVIVTLTEEQDLYPSIEPDTPIYCLYKSPGNDLATHVKLFRLLRSLNADVLHTYNFGTIEYHCTARLAGIKTLVHADHGRGGDSSGGSDRLRNLVRKFSALFLKQYVVVSPDLYQWARDELHISEDKLQLIYNGVNLEEYRPGNEKFDRYTICTVGRAHPVKNQAMLIQAFARAREADPSFGQAQLLLVGDGPCLPELEQLVTSLQLRDHVQLLGYREDVAGILRKSHVFVLSSLYEAMPMTLLEAMACELPVVSTDVGGVQHLVSDEEGWLVPSDNAQAMADTLLSLFRDHDACRKKARAGKEMVVANYSIDVMVNRYAAIYDQ